MQAAALAAGILTLSSVISQANSYLDFDLINKKLNANHESYTGSFNIATGDGDAGDVWGYNPAVEHVTSAVGFFEFTDDDPVDETGTADPPREKVKISIGSVNNWQGKQEIDLDTFLGGAIEGKLLVDLRADGTLDYEVIRKRGDFYLLAAVLGAETGPGAVRGVPDRLNTLLSLAMGVTGLVALRRTRFQMRTSI